MFKWFSKPKKCAHEFYGYDMESRDENGNVHWPCSKCKKLFVAECGLDILRHGKAMGGWGLKDRRETK